MKNSTVLAAALAAGLTTFAANAQEEGARQVSMVSAGTIGAWTRDARTGKGGGVASKETAPAARGLTSEETFHAAKVAKADEPRLKDDVAVGPQQRYGIIIARYALENGVAIDLAHAVITVESNFRVYSLGKAGEVGLMQIKPATAKLMGYDGSTTGLFDPETNIKFGMKYLGKAQRLGDGTTCGTILKYNAGHAAKRMNAVSRDYCKKVKRQLAGLDV